MKNDIENTAVRAVQSVIKGDIVYDNKKARELHKTVESLKKRNLLFTRADKSNNVVVMEREYYERIVLKTIANGPYEKMNEDPLQRMVRDVNEVLERHKHILCENPRRDLRHWKVSNPQVPCLYVMLKTHKEVDSDGDLKARPVASNTNAPTEAMSKKLSKIFNDLPPPKGMTVKNGTDFANLVNGMEVRKCEEMGSYDVTSLYPSVPVPYALDTIMEWLIANKVERDTARAYVEMAKTCMDQNIFQFNGEWYIQFEGTSIGNSLSSFVAESFMCRFEMAMKDHPKFPRFYRRYIDDIFAIQNARFFEAVREVFERYMDSIKEGAIKFTVERQREDKLPFLNVMCEIVNGRIEVDVYRKPSSTMRSITCDSFHDQRHKMAAYHSMANFMVSIPLSDKKFRIETEKIIRMGAVNGYRESTVRSIINKHVKKRERTNFSTLEDSEAESKKRVSVRYFPLITNQIKEVYKEHDLELVFRNDGSLRQHLGTTKDKPLDLHRSGIYRIQCGCCGRLYFGLTVRKLFERFNEHIKSTNWKNKTAVGRHIFSTQHDIHISDLKLIQPIATRWKIEYFEAIHIHKHRHENLLNIDDGNITSPLLRLFTIERKTDTHIIDLTNDTPNTSIDEIFYECE